MSADLYYQDDTLFPFVLTFRAERINRHLSAEELRAWQGGEVPR